MLHSQLKNSKIDFESLRKNLYFSFRSHSFRSRKTGFVYTLVSNASYFSQNPFMHLTYLWQYVFITGLKSHIFWKKIRLIKVIWKKYEVSEAKVCTKPENLVILPVRISKLLDCQNVSVFGSLRRKSKQQGSSHYYSFHDHSVIFLIVP